MHAHVIYIQSFIRINIYLLYIIILVNQQENENFNKISPNKGCKHLGINQKIKILELYNKPVAKDDNPTTFTSVANEIKCDRRTISRFISKWNETKTLEIKVQKGKVEKEKLLNVKIEQSSERCSVTHL